MIKHFINYKYWLVILISINCFSYSFNDTLAPKSFDNHDWSNTVYFKSHPKIFKKINQNNEIKLKIFLSKINPSKTISIVDMGSGTGKDQYKHFGKNINIIGYDKYALDLFLPSLYEDFEAFDKFTHDTKLPFIIHDASDTKIPSNMIDKVTINFPHPKMFEDENGELLNLIKEAFRILKQGGTLEIITERTEDIISPISSRQSIIEKMINKTLFIIDQTSISDNYDSFNPTITLGEYAKHFQFVKKWYVRLVKPLQYYRPRKTKTSG